MTSVVVPSAGGFALGIFGRKVTESVKVAPFTNHGSYSVQKLPTDAIGTTVVTFDGVPAGAEIRVFLPDMTEVAGIESCAANQVLSWPVYSIGTPNNTVRIVIIDLTHKIKEFNYTSQLGTQIIPVQSENDKWWLNP